MAGNLNLKFDALQKTTCGISGLNNELLTGRENGGSREPWVMEVTIFCRNGSHESTADDDSQHDQANAAAPGSLIPFRPDN